MLLFQEVSGSFEDVSRSFGELGLEENEREEESE
jgi:hypothetical protein